MFAYGRVLRLITNFDKMKHSDLMKYSLTAVMLTVYLKNKTNFFENLPECWELLISSLIMRHIGQLICNGHAITDLVMNSFQDSMECPSYFGFHLFFKIERVFTAIFPMISLLNHSCNPNISNSFNQDELIIRATRKICKNEEVFNCYGPNYKIMDRHSRKRSLQQQYCFICDCNKCKCDKNDFDYYLCNKQNCNEKIYLKNNFWYKTNEIPKILCGKCKNNLNLDWYKFHRECIYKFDGSHNQDHKFFQVILKNYEKSKSNLSKNHCIKEDMASDIISCFISLSCVMDFDVHISFSNLVLEYIDLVKFRYGELSHEYVMSCTYLLDIMAYRKHIKKEQITDGLNYFKDFQKILSNQAYNVFRNYIFNYIE